MKKEKKLRKIGTKLGLSETDVKSELANNRYKIAAGLIVGITSLAMGKIFFEPLHYTAASMGDFEFLTRFF